jgi:hypothetical protein
MAQVGFEAQPLVGFHRVRSAILQFVSAKFVQQADTAALLVFVDQHAAAFFGDEIQRKLQLRAAIAPQAMKNIPRQALRMNSNQRSIPVRSKIAHAQHHAFLHVVAVHALESEDAEMSETAGKIGFRYFVDHGGDFAFIIMIGRRVMLEPQQLLVVLLLRLAVAASLASILSRFSAFQRMLMREERTLVQRVKLALSCSAAYGAGVATRALNPAYQAVDLGMEG